MTKLKKYVVISLSVGGNKVYKNKEIVDQSNFPHKTVEELVKEGFLKAVKVDKDKIKADKIEADKIEADKIEADKIEADKIEADKIEADKIEADKK